MMTSRQNHAIATKRIGAKFMRYVKILFVLALIGSVGSLLNVAFEAWYFANTGITLNAMAEQYLNQFLLTPEQFAEAYPNAAWISEQMMKDAALLSNAVSVAAFAVNFIVGAFLAMPTAKMFYMIINGQSFTVKELFRGAHKGIPIYLLSALKVLLWSLLFIVPGIIKAIAYSMSYFVKIENPEMSAGQCIERSCEITNGRKGAYFKLMLHFLIYAVIAYFAASALAYFFSVIFAMMLSSLPVAGVIAAAVINLLSTIFCQTFFFSVKWSASEALFYEDAKRSWREEMEMDLRFKHETGADFENPYEQEVEGAGRTATANPFGDENTQATRKIDPFE